MSRLNIHPIEHTTLNRDEEDAPRWKSRHGALNFFVKIPLSLISSEKSFIVSDRLFVDSACDFKASC